MMTGTRERSAGELRGSRLRCERLVDPLAVDAKAPRLSWIVVGPEGARGARQTAYRIVAAASRHALVEGRELLWDSGRVESTETLDVPWRGPRLEPGARAYWRTTVWDESKRPGPPSDIAVWGAGLTADQWDRARWIGHGHPWAEHAPPGEGPPDPLLTMGMSSALLRTEFALERPVARATAYATARGLYRLHLNGTRVSDHELAPGWTDYHTRIHYQAFDVTALLRPGANALGIELAEGWYAGYVGFDRKRAGAHYGHRPSALLLLRVEHGDGTLTVVGSSEAWRTRRGPRVYADLQMGERFDARLVEAGWTEARFDDARWEPAVVHDAPCARLEPSPCEPIRRQRELTAVALSEPRPGAYVFDLGQNIAGWTRLRAAGPRGTTLTLRFAEALDADGTIYTDNLRAAAQRDTFVLDGALGGEELEPAFTFHGFRYVEVTGLHEPPACEDLTGCVVHTDARWVGTFSCSHDLLNAIHRNAAWGQRGNFVGVPTDCPQRDERLGWLADTQVFAATALLNMDCGAFLAKWLQDVRDAQAQDGAFPDVAPCPTAFPALSHGAPGWGDAGVLVPWLVWRASGERAVLERAYPAMERWMEHLGARNPDHLRRHARYNDYGDWLNVDAETPKDLLATAYWALDARVLERIAGVLGRTADIDRWRSLHGRIADAFVAAYVGDDGRLRRPTQTGYLLALHADVLPEQVRAAAVEGLVDEVLARDRHLSTGFLGTGLVCPILTEHGHAALAYDLALNDTYPSWGSSIRSGATTMWERWDGWTEEHGFQSPSMNSFNHYAFGAIGEWLYRHVAGLDQDPRSAGYAHVRIRPYVDPRLSWARAEHDSVRGPVRVAWERVDGMLALDVEIPANAVGTVLVPTSDPRQVCEGRRPLAQAPGVTAQRVEDGCIVVRVESGRYAFTAPTTTTGSVNPTTTRKVADSRR
jgi:alpha-L-rhamnosidase